MSGARNHERGRPRGDSSVLSRNDRRRSAARRRLLKGVLAGGAAAGSAKAILPGSWTRPLVEAAVLPAHAQATGEVTVTLRGPIVVTTASGFLYRESSPTRTAGLGQRVLEALVPEARAGAQQGSIVQFLDMCCLTLVVAGQQVSFTIDCRCPIGPLNGSGTRTQLEGSGISGDGITVTASSFSESEAVGEITDGIDLASYVVTPGPCEPMDGNSINADDDALACDLPPR